MTKRINSGIGMVCAAVLTVLTGCMTPTTNIDNVNDTAGAIMGFDYRDIDRGVREAVGDMLARGRLERPDNGRYVVNVKPVKDDTFSRGRDTGALSEAISVSLREELTNAKKIIVYNEEVARYAATPVVPQLVLYGTLSSRFLTMDNGNRQIEYFLNLQLVEIATGLEFWQKRVFIGKRTDARRGF